MADCSGATGPLLVYARTTRSVTCVVRDEITSNGREAAAAAAALADEYTFRHRASRRIQYTSRRLESPVNCASVVFVQYLRIARNHEADSRRPVRELAVVDNSRPLISSSLSSVICFCTRQTIFRCDSC